MVFEGKSETDALIDVGLGYTLDKTISILGDAAKSTVKGAEKQMHDTIVSGYELELSNLFQWVAGKIKGDDDKDAKKETK